MKTITGVLILAAAVAVHAGSHAPADLEAYNLVWTSPSTNAAGRTRRCAMSPACCGPTSTPPTSG